MGLISATWCQPENPTGSGRSGPLVQLAQSERDHVPVVPSRLGNLRCEENRLEARSLGPRHAGPRWPSWAYLRSLCCWWLARARPRQAQCENEHHWRISSLKSRNTHRPIALVRWTGARARRPGRMPNFGSLPCSPDFWGVSPGPEGLTQPKGLPWTALTRSSAEVAGQKTLLPTFPSQALPLPRFAVTSPLVSLLPDPTSFSQQPQLVTRFAFPLASGHFSTGSAELNCPQQHSPHGPPSLVFEPG